MPGEVDRVLQCMRRVERLTSELCHTNAIGAGLIRAHYDRALREERVAITELVSAAHRGDPEAIVALDVLAEEIEEKTWDCPRSAA